MTTRRALLLYLAFVVALIVVYVVNTALCARAVAVLGMC